MPRVYGIRQVSGSPLYMRRILFVFLDGVGLGPPGPENPLSKYDGAGLLRLSQGESWTTSLEEQTASQHLVRHLDATLGVDGLPQSGTGQAALFTGVNCAKRVGRHFGPFPHSATFEVIDHKSVFHQVQALYSSPEPVAFANAFPPQFFQSTRRRWTVTTRCCTNAEVPLRGLDSLQKNRAVTADLTGRAWRELLDLDVMHKTEADAARDLWLLHRDHRFTLFEYFLTDKVGHRRLDLDSTTLLKSLDRFFDSLLDRLNPATESLVVTSDHGNMENGSHTQHTRNPVPLFVQGWAAPYFTEAHDLLDVTPAIVNALRQEEKST